MMVGFFCLNFVIYFLYHVVPEGYLVQTRGFSLKSLHGTLGMIPALISIPGGWLGGIVFRMRAL